MAMAQLTPDELTELKSRLDASYNPILSLEKREQMARDFIAGATRTELAQRYQVSPQYVTKVLRGAAKYGLV